MMNNIRFGTLCLLAAAATLCGCATSTIEKRKQERYAAYSSLSPEQRVAVDAGQIKVGMSMDAVFIAWGKPHQVMQAETSEGSQTIWLYFDTYLQGYHYWSYGHGPYPYYRRGRYHHYYEPGPRLQYDYHPVGYMRAEVIFESSLVKRWRTLPRPGY